MDWHCISRFGVQPCGYRLRSLLSMWVTTVELYFLEKRMVSRISRCKLAIGGKLGINR